MKQHVLSFLKRGLMCCAGGPVILAIIYGILGKTGVIESLSAAEACRGVLTVTLMAFIAAGITTVYDIEQLPLFWAILLHGVVLYLDYILIYLLNGWIQSQWRPVLIFTGAFIAGYAVIWAIIYCCTKRSADALNRKMTA